MDYASDFMANKAAQFEKAGGKVRHMSIDDKNLTAIGVDRGGSSIEQLSGTGKHEFIEVTNKNGDVMIFDNAFPEGISKKEYSEKVTAHWNNPSDGKPYLVNGNGLLDSATPKNE